MVSIIKSAQMRGGLEQVEGKNLSNVVLKGKRYHSAHLRMCERIIAK
jgi:hypothetical protein